MKKTRFFLIYFFVFIFASLFLAWAIPCHTNGLFEVEQGQGLFQIAENLKKQGFIQTEFPFYFYILAKSEVQNLKSGVYLFTSDDNFLIIAQKIIQGKTHTIKITIPEGFNLAQIDARLSEAELIGKREIINFDNANFQFPISLDASRRTPRRVAFQSIINYQLSNLEGFLFPDTYYFSPSIEVEEIVKVFLHNFDKKLTSELREEIQKQNKTIFEIITMASLIEKEVRTLENKKIVSGILWKRMENNIPLQVCPTIIYITGKQTTKISAEETKIDSPYNTYKYIGLPKGPICNPGLESIIAAVYPENSVYWYYLSNTKGETIFSRTLEEHNINKAKYLK